MALRANAILNRLYLHHHSKAWAVWSFWLIQQGCIKLIKSDSNAI